MRAPAAPSTAAYDNATQDCFQASLCACALVAGCDSGRTPSCGACTSLRAGPWCPGGQGRRLYNRRLRVFVHYDGPLVPLQMPAASCPHSICQPCHRCVCLRGHGWADPQHHGQQHICLHRADHHRRQPEQHLPKLDLLRQRLGREWPHAGRACLEARHGGIACHIAAFRSVRKQLVAAAPVRTCMSQAPLRAPAGALCCPRGRRAWVEGKRGVDRPPHQVAPLTNHSLRATTATARTRAATPGISRQA